MVASLDPLSPELRAPVAARSLPDDGVLQNMRRALAALGGGGEDDADADGHPPSTSTTADASIVSALAAGELRRETQLWERMMYKSASQHRRAVHFQRMRGVTRRLREVAALDVGGAAAALRAGLDAGVSEDARAAALASPAVAAGAHAIWKLPSRALWDDLSRRLLAAARVAAETDEALLAAATSLSGQLAHTFFMPFALVAVASIARLRACLHQLAVDVVSTYNILAPLLGGGNMPPPGLPGDSADATRAPESLRCEWSTVTPPPPPPGANPPREIAAGEARRPKVRGVESEANVVGGIHDEDWNWRLLRRAPASGDATTTTTTAITNAQTTTRFDGAGGEDLGSAVPRNVRGLEAKIDKGKGEDGVRAKPAAPAYSRSAFGLGIAIGVAAPHVEVEAKEKVKEEKVKEKEKEREGRVKSAPSEEASTPAPLVMDFASLTAGLAPKRAAPAEDGKPGGKKRRRPGAGSAEKAAATGTATATATATAEGAKKKKKKKKKSADGEADGAAGSSKPMSAVDRAMAMLMGHG